MVGPRAWMALRLRGYEEDMKSRMHLLLRTVNTQCQCQYTVRQNSMFPPFFATECAVVVHIRTRSGYQDNVGPIMAVTAPPYGRTLGRLGRRGGFSVQMHKRGEEVAFRWLRCLRRLYGIDLMNGLADVYRNDSVIPTSPWHRRRRWSEKLKKTRRSRPHDGKTKAVPPSPFLPPSFR